MACPCKELWRNINRFNFDFMQIFFFWRNINWLNFNFMQVYFYPRNLFIIIRCNRAFWAEIDWEKKKWKKERMREKKFHRVHEWNSYQWWRHLMKWPADQVHGKLPKQTPRPATKDNDKSNWARYLPRLFTRKGSLFTSEAGSSSIWRHLVRITFWLNCPALKFDTDLFNLRMKKKFQIRMHWHFIKKQKYN